MMQQGDVSQRAVTCRPFERSKTMRKSLVTSMSSSLTSVLCFSSTCIVTSHEPQMALARARGLASGESFSRCPSLTLGTSKGGQRFFSHTNAVEGVHFESDCRHAGM